MPIITVRAADTQIGSLLLTRKKDVLMLRSGKQDACQNRAHSAEQIGVCGEPVFAAAAQGKGGGTILSNDPGKILPG